MKKLILAMLIATTGAHAGGLTGLGISPSSLSIETIGLKSEHMNLYKRTGSEWDLVFKTGNPHLFLDIGGYSFHCPTCKKGTTGFKAMNQSSTFIGGKLIHSLGPTTLTGSLGMNTHKQINWKVKITLPIDDRWSASIAAKGRRDITPGTTGLLVSGVEIGGKYSLTKNWGLTASYFTGAEHATDVTDFSMFGVEYNF